MNDIQRQQIHDLRNAGYSYKKIAQKLEINENTVKTYCKLLLMNPFISVCIVEQISSSN